MANLFGLFGEAKRKQKPVKQIMIKGELLEVAFKIAKCMDEETELFVLKEKVE